MLVYKCIYMYLCFVFVCVCTRARACMYAKVKNKSLVIILKDTILFPYE